MTTATPVPLGDNLSGHFEGNNIVLTIGPANTITVILTPEVRDAIAALIDEHEEETTP
jgi:hypothetical protein